MFPIRRAEARLGIPTTRRLVDVAFLLGFVGALAVCFWTGLPPVWIGAVAVGSVALQYLVDSVAADQAFGAVGRAEEAPASLKRTVGDLAVELGIDAPRAVVEPDGETVTVLGDGRRAVVVVGESLVADLDDATLRGILAHEIAHVSLGHFRRVPLRRPVAHVVGFAACWVLALQHLVTPFAVMGGLAYLAAGASRTDSFDAAVYVLASAGVVLIPMALSAYASRLEECQADDLAVATTSAADFCRGLARVESAASRRSDRVLQRTPLGGRRTGFGRLVAVHPSVEYRLARQGFSAAELRQDRP